jgi:GR25 family glycosyltransferase involved in LPS biosynthesis
MFSGPRMQYTSSFSAVRAGPGGGRMRRGTGAGSQAMSSPVEQTAETDTAVFHPCPSDPACPYCNGTIDPNKALDWSFLDGAYCISLKSREDRATNVAAEFHRVGLCRHVIFYRPVKHPVKGIIGSWESHRACGEHAMQHGCKTALIMEDDVAFSRNLRPSKVRSVARALGRLPPDWMIFFLGHWPVWAYFVRHNVLRTGSACAHAYIVSPRLMQWLHEHPWGSPDVRKMRLVGKALDSAYAELPGAYALFPMIATQSVSKSDNFNFRPKTRQNRKLKHLVTHSRHRELMLSKLMRPAEMIVAALSPVFFVVRMSRRLRSRDATRRT